MSTVEKALKSLKNLVEQPGIPETEIVVSTQLPVSKRYVDEISRFTGVSVSDVEKRCMESVDAEEWCEWVAEILRGRRRDPPNRPLPNGVLEILYAMVSRGANDPLIEQIVNSRKVIQKIVSEASEKATSIIDDVVKGRRKVASESFSSLIENIMRKVKDLRGNPDEVVEQVLSSMETTLREKYKAPVSSGELVSSVMNELKRVGLPVVSEKAVSIIESKIKEVSATSPEEIKKLGFTGDQQVVDLSKKPFSRMTGG